MIHYQWKPRSSKPLAEAVIHSSRTSALIDWGDKQNPPRNVAASYLIMRTPRGLNHRLSW
jgi:hypothetical protein